jgi:5'-AMP-activated protein kinase catalytic alpha subunit
MGKKIGKYELHRTLGEGSFGKVKYAIHTETNEPVAIKILDKETLRKKNMSAQIKKEIALMRLINHRHVIGIKDVFATATNIFIVLELVEGGELFDKIVEEGRLSEDRARFYMRQLLDGMECCHAKGVCHRDLKPENLLLDSNGDLKISDFGMATLYIGDANAPGDQRTELLHTTCGTPNYVAPEVLTSQGYDGHKADVWSMGVILFVFLSGYLPFEETTTAALFKKIRSAEFNYPSDFPATAKDLLGKVLVVDPEKRSSLRDFKRHEWVQEGGGYDVEDDPVSADVINLEFSNGNGQTGTEGRPSSATSRKSDGLGEGSAKGIPASASGSFRQSSGRGSRQGSSSHANGSGPGGAVNGETGAGTGRDSGSVGPQTQTVAGISAGSGDGEGEGPGQKTVGQGCNCSIS